MTDQLQLLRDSLASMTELTIVYREQRDQQQIRAEAAEAELREATRWRPVSELPPRDAQFPDFSVDVVMCRRNNNSIYDVGQYSFRDEEWLADSGDSIPYTHWMPLPEAPKQ